MNEQKVFAVGFHKTATTSIANSLYVLGYRLEGHHLDGLDEDQLPNLPHDVARQQVWEAMERILRNCDAVQDIPWSVFYRELDQAYPNSKFILTVRATDSWFGSVDKHFGSKRIPHHEWIYGVPCATGHEEIYRSTYEQHNADVRGYFADRPDDLLEFAPGDELSWERLCGFLGHEVPPFPFPRQNQASAKNQALPARLIRVARRSLQKVTKQESDFDVALGLHYDTRDHLRRFESNVVALIESEPDDVKTVFADLTSMMFTVGERVAVLKSFMGLEGQADPVESIDSVEEFRLAWRRASVDIRHVAGTVTDQTVYETVPATGESLLDSAQQIDEILRACEDRIGASRLVSN